MRLAEWQRLACIGFSLIACAVEGSRSTPGRDLSYTLHVGDRTRAYELHVPATPQTPRAPLVVLLHGRLGTGAGMARLTDFNALADRDGILVAYPKGYRRSWADGRGGTPADQEGLNDVGFVATMLADIAAHWPVDPARIYVAGISNGGFMAERLACELSGTLAGAGFVAATLGDSLAARCHPAHPISVLFINGTDDPLVPFEGGELKGGRGRALSAPVSVARWVRWDGCSDSATVRTLPDTVHDGTQVTEAGYTGCRNGVAVVAIRVAGGGHTWPGGPQYLPVALVGRASRNLNASSTLWDFFAPHRTP